MNYKWLCALFGAQFLHKTKTFDKNKVGFANVKSFGIILRTKLLLLFLALSM